MAWGSTCNIILQRHCHQHSHIHQNQQTHLISTMNHLRLKLQHFLPWRPCKGVYQICPLLWACCILPVQVLNQHGHHPSHHYIHWQCLHKHRLMCRECLHKYRLMRRECLQEHTWGNKYLVPFHLPVIKEWEALAVRMLLLAL